MEKNINIIGNKEKEKKSLRTYIESYGCQMNVSDSEIIASFLLKKGFSITNNLEEANIILINTCSIREKAELTLKLRLQKLKYLKSIKRKEPLLFGILGCMSETIKKLDKEDLVDFVISPDSYRKISDVIFLVRKKKKYSQILSKKINETYDDVTPYQLDHSKKKKNIHKFYLKK
ncbi:hypothetical protein [Blattabacterium cuenoti]|nr:hypothetical protein [Blattabacterium cuenoti]